MSKASVLAVMTAILSLHALAQSGSVKQPQFPGSIQLLPNYRLNARMGIESAGGEILNEGLTIFFDIGGNAGNWAGSVTKRSIVWRREQIVHGHHILCTYTKQRELIVTFPYLVANFRAKIKNQQDIADMLLIVLTYQPVPGVPPEPDIGGPSPH